MLSVSNLSKDVLVFWVKSRCEGPTIAKNVMQENIMIIYLLMNHKFDTKCKLNDNVTFSRWRSLEINGNLVQTKPAWKHFCNSCSKYKCTSL